MAIDEARPMFDDGMWIIYLEALLALCLLVFIVWYTMPKQKKEASKPEKPGGQSADGGGR
jgi:hypothetical protein